MAEYIVQIEESEKNMEERFVGQLRSYPELIRCKDCDHSKPWYRDKCLCYLWADGIDVYEDGYCNYAKRKDE